MRCCVRNYLGTLKAPSPIERNSGLGTSRSQEVKAVAD